MQTVLSRASNTFCPRDRGSPFFFDIEQKHQVGIALGQVALCGLSGLPKNLRAAS